MKKVTEDSECRWPREVEKDKRRNSPLEPPEGSSPADTLTSPQWNLFQSSDLQNYKIYEFVLF